MSVCCFLIFETSTVTQKKFEKSFSKNVSYTSTPEKSAETSKYNFDTSEENTTFKPVENPKLNIFNQTSSSFDTSFFDNFASFRPNDTTPIFGQKPVFDNPLTFKFSPTYRNPFNDSFEKRSLLDESVNSLDDTLNYKQNNVNLESSINEKLNKLHLGTYSRVMNSNELPSAFRISPNLTRPKPVLSPPKLHNVTQSSWLAGGYWKNPDYPSNFSSLSRSSSQSSGFGSQASSQNLNLDVYSSLPPSRNNSVCGEFDKFSVFSEPAYHSNTQKNNKFSHCDSLFVPTATRNVVKPVLSPLNDNFWRSDMSFRPEISSSLSQSKLSTNSVSTPIRNNFIVSSITCKNSSSFVKGSLLQKWREQNCVDHNDC